MVLCCVFLELCQRGVGKMILRLMQGFFGTGSGVSEPADNLTEKGMSVAVWFLFSGIFVWLYIYFVHICVLFFLSSLIL